jgi:hypothetical protein
MHFGCSALVKKLGRGWQVDFRGHGHPVIYKTKRQATEMASAWISEVCRAGLHRRGGEG